MPLRDHFHGPLHSRRSWEGVHSLWPGVIVLDLNRRLPARYRAEPGVHVGTGIDIDVATFDTGEDADWEGSGLGENGGGGVATAVWAPPRPSLSFATGWPAQDEYEVRVYDDQEGSRLVAAIEIVSPSNKDRPESRRAFITKCAAMLEDRVCVSIVDLVTNRTANLGRELLEFLGAGPVPDQGEASTYAIACRATRKEKTWMVESWIHEMKVGQPLPTLPLWLADNLSLPLDLESSYEETCRGLRLR